MFTPDIKSGVTLSNDQIMQIFKCGKQGGMRRSLATNSLVLITDKLKGTYKDRWEGDILHYTGMGLTGNQDLSNNQNRTLAESNTNGIALFLFEVFEKHKYYYHGRVSLASEPYQEEQSDINGNSRNVWIFPLVLIDSDLIPVDVDLVQKAEEESEKLLSFLSTNELANRIKTRSKKPSYRKVTQTRFERDSYVAEYVKRKANGVCQLCGTPAPFNTNSGVPYLEEHHIDWLSKGGTDSVENASALCPNCHRKMHVLNLPEDRLLLMGKAAGVYKSFVNET